MSVQWARPELLLLLLLVPLYAWWLAGGRRGGPRIEVLRFAGAASFRSALGSSAWRAFAPEVLRAVALTALVVGLAGPRVPTAVVTERGEGIPMIIALDISSSMLAQDFQPRDRLEVAKQTTAQFIRARESDPIGVVAFAGEALTLVPVTRYQPVLLNALSSLRVGLLEDGTAIGDGLATAVNRLRRVPAEDRVVILLSDGESNRGAMDPRQAARAAAALGVTVFTVGVGSDGSAPVPVRRTDAGIQYAEVPVAIDEELLREVARLTGGEYFRATDPEALRSVYARIDRLVRSPLETRSYARYTEWLPYLLAAAAALLALEWLLRGSRWGRVP